jgi:hypothetical protein
MALLQTQVTASLPLSPSRQKHGHSAELQLLDVHSKANCMLFDWGSEGSRLQHPRHTWLLTESD